MSLRRRLTVLCTGVVGVVVLAASLVCYLAMRSELRGQIDEGLRAQAELVQARPFVQAVEGPDEVVRAPVPGELPLRLRVPQLPARLGQSAGYVVLLRRDGEVVRPGAQDVVVPVTSGDRAASGEPGAVRLDDRQADGVHLRVATIALDGGGTLLIGRSLESVDDSLASLRLVLGLLALAGIGAAVGAARLLARPVIAPITALSGAAEHVGATGDLSRRVPVDGDDEVGRLGRRFNTMLDQLQASVAAQRQLVADASHELRTPVTALRTNAELLGTSGAALDDDARAAAARDLVGQSEELTALVGDLIELARGDAREPDHEDVRLDALAAEAVERARRHAPGLEVVLDAAPVVVEGAPDRLARAVNNLLDNAAKFSPPGGRIEVAVRDGALEVRDHGPGVAAEDLPHVFDRFHRGRGAEGRPGSGLGLAIVKQVADAHGAAVSLAPAPGGGTVARLAFPPAP